MTAVKTGASSRLSRLDIPRNIFDDRFFEELSERHNGAQERHTERQHRQNENIPAVKLQEGNAKVCIKRKWLQKSIKAH